MSSPSFASGRAAPSAAEVPTIEFRNISKRFGSIQALSDVSFAGHAGSVHAITGENGAGKSTLMKLLAGVFSPDSGEIRLEGRATAFESASRRERRRASPRSSRSSRCSLISRSRKICFSGASPGASAWSIARRCAGEAREALDRIGIDFDAEASCGELVIAEQHLIEIAKGAAANSRIIIYDEPTAALDARGVDKLVGLIEAQKAAGKLIFYISHRLDEIFRLCDTTTVLKDGRHVTTCPTADLTRDSLVSLMVGRELSQFFPPRPATPARPNIALAVSDYVAGPAEEWRFLPAEPPRDRRPDGPRGTRAARRHPRSGRTRSRRRAGVAKKYDREGAAKTLPGLRRRRRARWRRIRSRGSGSRKGSIFRCRSPRISESACCAAHR